MIAICVVAALYQFVAILACIRRTRVRVTSRPVSILKPVYRITDDVVRAIQTHLKQDYGADYELLLGVREASKLTIQDPRLRVILCRTVTPNRKVGTLIDLAKQAKHETLIVNDADIAVPPDYLNEIQANLQQPNIGLVTCLYKAESKTWPGRFEGLGVATDFAPSALVAPFVGVSEFGLGSTLAFHRADLDKIGGFEVIADYLADDYQLGCKLHAIGRRNVIAKPVVTTTLDPPTWAAAWKHQIRWSRTVRLSRKAGYIGLPVTFATLWSLIALLTSHPVAALTLFTIRMIMAITAGYGVLKSKDVLKYFYLIPIRDLYSVAIWAAALFGNKVEWGDETLTLDRKGRIVDIRHL